MDWSLVTRPDFLARVRRHFVCLTGTVGDLDRQGRPGGDERHFCCSGFVVEIRGAWCFVTAGHVLEEIDSGIRCNRFRLLTCGLADFFSPVARVKEPIPFPYQDVHRVTVDRDGFDIGLIPLGDLFRRSIEANGVCPVPVAPWPGFHPPRFDGYAVLGLPRENMESLTREGERGPQIGHSVWLMLVGVDAILTPPVGGANHALPRFRGALRDGNQLSSAVGLSGGPIIGMNVNGDGTLDYGCVAVQGSWNRSDRIVSGTPMGVVVSAVNDLLDAHAAALRPNVS